MNQASTAAINQVSQVNQKVLEGISVRNGDIKLENITQIGSQTIISKEVSFFEPELKPFSLPDFPSPKISEELVNILSRNHFLVLGDGANVDKSALARHLATLLSEKIKIEKNIQKVIVKEWYRTSNSGDIEFELDSYDLPKIIILTQAAPQNLLSYNFLDLQKFVEKTDHFIIATTDLPFNAWNLLDSCQVWWRDLSDKDVADSERLVNKLSHEETLNSWYHNSLDTREQLLAIGLSLFDGLFDDQFFAALEEVVSQVWQNRDSNLKALDYCDLDKLRNYFDFIDTDDQRTLVKIRFPKQRLTCLKIAWRSHRRQILAALPILVDIVRNTVQSYSGELYSSPVRREKLRQSVGEAISGIGLISRLGSREAVEESLLTLAASPDIEVQAVAAQSIASWRDQESKGFVLDGQADLDVNKELFDLLEGWQTETQINRFISFILKDKAKEESNQPADYIRATLAITIAFASTYDPADHLSDKLFQLFKELSEDKNKLVRDRFKRYTLPLFIGRHLFSIRDFVGELISDVDLIAPVAESLALVYKFNHYLIVSLLQDWKSDCQNKYKKVAPRGSVGQRESRLITLSLTYSQIFKNKQFELQDGVSISSAYLELIEILSFEKHQLVRQVLVESIGSLIKNNYDTLVEEIDQVVKYISYGKESEILEEALSEIYYQQRSALNGGDEVVKIDGRKYSIWLNNSERKSVPIELVFFAWIKNDKNRRLQKISARCIMGFVKQFEEKENKAVNAVRNRINAERYSIIIKSASEEISSSPIIPEPLIGNKYLEKFIPWLATQQAESYRPSVSHILPEAVKQSSLVLSGSKFLFNKLDQSNDNELVNLSRFLKRGVWLSKNFAVISILLAIVILGSGIWMRARLGDIVSQSPEPQPSPGVPGNNPPTQEPENTIPNPFDQEQFPKSSCGDPLPADNNLYPIQYFPVFVNYSNENLEAIKESFCQDALRNNRAEAGKESIQVASFISREQAEFFLNFLSRYFEGAEIGEPSLIERPPSSSSSLPLIQKGPIEFSAGSTSAQLEDRFSSPSVHQFTLIASEGQPSSFAVSSSSEQTYLNISTPNGRSLVDYQYGLDTWNGTLPESGTYQISVFGFQAPSTYQLSITIEP